MTPRDPMAGAPDPASAPPVSLATRRDLFGTMGTMLLLTAAEAGAGKAAELDRDLLAACAAFYDADRTDRASNTDEPTPSDELVEARRDARDELLDQAATLPARTPEGLMAKAAVLRVAMHRDVTESLNETFADRAEPYHVLADSLCRDLLGRARA